MNIVVNSLYFFAFFRKDTNNFKIRDGGKIQMADKVYLVLENKRVFTGEVFGYKKEAIGDLVFSTAMIGYLETVTDSNYFGQMVLQTFPLIGNYGFIPQDVVGETPVLSAYIINELCQEPSNFRSVGTLDTFLKENKIPGIMGLPTREITKIIRDNGTMKAKLCLTEPDVEKVLAEFKEIKPVNAVAAVTATEITVKTPQTVLHKVAVWDFGAREYLTTALLELGCEVYNLPASTTCEEIVKLNLDGIVLSNGPANPEDNKEIIAEIASLVATKLPILGIDLGHQLLAISQGATTKKLKHGHHGNQPIINEISKRVYISTQNHDYAVKTSTLPHHSVEIYANANDLTCAGLRYSDFPAFSVQFMPGGDTEFVFSQFIDLIKEDKANAIK